MSSISAMTCLNVPFPLLSAVDLYAYKLVDKLGSDRISDVIDVYEHALCSRFPRARYVVGKDAKFIFLPLQAMPEWLGDWIQETVFRDKPVPAALKKQSWLLWLNCSNTCLMYCDVQLSLIYYLKKRMTSSQNLPGFVSNVQSLRHFHLLLNIN